MDNPYPYWGGSAFPCSDPVEHTETFPSKKTDGATVTQFFTEECDMPEADPGMSLLDYFAAKALAAVVSRKDIEWLDTNADLIARLSYRLAQAMLNRREMLWEELEIKRRKQAEQWEAERAGENKSE